VSGKKYVSFLDGARKISNFQEGLIMWLGEPGIQGKGIKNENDLLGTGPYCFI
jgi:hypothetical protein